VIAVSLPLSNPPPSHKLQTHKYDSFDDLIDDLHEYTVWRPIVDTVVFQLFEFLAPHSTYWQVSSCPCKVLRGRC